MSRAISTGTGTGAGIATGFATLMLGGHLAVWFLSSNESGKSFNAQTEAWPEWIEAVIGLGLLLAIVVAGYAVGGITKVYVDERIAQQSGHAGPGSLAIAGLGWIAVAASVFLIAIALIIVYIFFIAFAAMIGLIGLFAITSD
ncbi:MAG: hypothetical protein U5K77_02440 [Candidatus Saccharibacteria bacterium]|nr:hypothetical protein [Candidatus Saccharibacteria bacterium]